MEEESVSEALFSFARGITPTFSFINQQSEEEDEGSLLCLGGPVRRLPLYSV